MRKSLFFMTAAILSAALSMTSCSNEADELVVPAAKKMMSVTLTLPDDAGTRATFEANMDGDTFKGLKTAWEDGDEISVGKMNVTNSFATFTMTSVSEDGKSATFTGEALDSWGEIANGTEFWFTYPVLLEGDYTRDWTAQEGTLSNLPKYDNLWFYVKYSDGKFDMENVQIQREEAFLRLPNQLAICDESFTGKITLEIMGSAIFSKSLSSGGWIDATTENPIVVGPVNVSNGVLEDDVYVALPILLLGDMNGLDMVVTDASGSWSNRYSLEYSMSIGNIYTLTNMNKLTLEESVKVGQVIGADGKFYANKAAASEAGTIGEAMVAYLGTAPAGGNGDATTTRGLAIALEDVGSWIGGDGISNVASWAESHVVNGGTWRVPKADDVKYMMQGCGGDAYTTTLNDEMEFDPGNFLTLLSSAGGTLLNQEYLWYKTTTKTSNGRYIYHFGITPSGGSWWTDGVSEGWYVRAVLAF